MARKRITRKNIPAVTPELKSAVETYLLAKATVGIIRPAIDEIDRQVLVDYPLHYDRTFLNRRVIDPAWVAAREANGNRITNIDDTYMGDSNELEGYYAAREAAIAAAGYTVRKPGNCPACEAESDLCEAERNVITSGAYLTAKAGVEVTPGKLIRLGVDEYKKFVDLTVGFVLSMCPEIDAKALMAKVGAHA